MKKKIAFFVCVCIVFCAVPVFSLEMNDSTGELVGNKLEILQELGLWSGAVSELEATVTRAEFIEMANRFYGIQTEEPGETYFADVTKEHPSYAAIAAAARRGIIYGDGTNFEPEREISLDEALKIMMVAQGFMPYANERGGYPVGYLSCAREIGVIKGITLEQNVSYAKVIQLFYNAAESDVLVPVVLGNGKTKYEYRGNVLSEYHSIYKAVGQVTENYDTGLYGESALPKDRIRIDEQEYIAPYHKTSRFLGVKVSAYYRQDREEDPSIVYMSEAPNVKVLTINSDSIISFDGAKLKYYDQAGSERSAVATVNAAWLYNGKAVGDFADLTLRMMMPENGDITLINNGAGYQVVKITDYDTIVVSGVSKNSEKFYDKYTGRPIDLEIADRVSICDKDGNEIALESLSEYDIASVAVSAGSNPSIFIVVSADAVEGKITAVGPGENGKREIQISKEKFILNDTFDAYLQEQNQELEIGDSGVFYLDHMGKIAAYEKGASFGKQYAYFIAASENLFDGGRVKLLGQSGKIQILELASKVKFGSQDAVSAQQACTYLKTLSGAKRLMMIEQNGNGEIRGITLPVEEGQEGELIQTYDSSAGKLRYKDVSQCFGGKYNIDGRTIVFTVPSAETETSAGDEDYGVRDYKRFVNDTGYAVSTFITSRDTLVQDIVLSYEDAGTGGAGEILTDARLGIVKEISTVVDDDETAVKCLSIMLEGKEISYKVDDESLLSGIHKGDAVRVSANSRGYLRTVDKRFDFETRAVLSGNKANGFDDINYVFYGKVLRKDGNIIRLEGVNEAGMTEQVNVLIRGNIYKIENKRGEVEVKTGAATDIVDEKALGDEASCVLIQSRYSDTRVVAVYE